MNKLKIAAALVICQSLALVAPAFCQAQSVNQSTKIAESVPAQVHNTVPPEMQDTGGQGLFDENGNLFMEEVADPKAKPKQKPKLLPIDLSRVGVSVNERGEIVPLRDPNNPTGVQQKFNVVEQYNEILPGGYYPGISPLGPGYLNGGFYPGIQNMYPGYMPYPGYNPYFGFNRPGLNINIPLGGGRNLSFGPNYGYNPYGVNPYGVNPYAGFNPYGGINQFNNFNASPFGAVSPYGNVFPNAPYSGAGVFNGFSPYGLANPYGTAPGLNLRLGPLNANYNSMWRSFNLSF